MTHMEISENYLITSSKPTLNRAAKYLVSAVNVLAPRQDPPRPALLYSEVVEYCSFSEFEILKHSDRDILSKDWAKLINRQAAKKYFKLKRAKEEVCRCNVEVARLQAWVDAEDADMGKAVATRQESDPVFAAHLKVIQIQRRRVNGCLRMRLQQIYSLPGYCGLHPPAANFLPSATARNSMLSSAVLLSLQAHLRRLQPQQPTSRSVLMVMKATTMMNCTMTRKRTKC